MQASKAITGSSYLPILFLVVAAALPAGPVAADTVELRLEPEGTEIELTLPATLHTVTGTAALVRGRLVFDTSGGPTRGEVVVDARSVETGNARRDSKMHADVLESARYETIELRPRRLLDPLEPGQNRTVRLEADLQIHGSRHAIELSVEVDWKSDEKTLHFRFALSLPYVEWGMEDPSTFLLKVGKEVEITVEGSAAVSTEGIGEASPR